jgi:hypothetical protein
VGIAASLSKGKAAVEAVGGLVASLGSYLPLIGTKLFAINPKIISDTWGFVLFAIPAAGLTSYVLTRLPTPRRPVPNFVRGFALFAFWGLGLFGLIVFLVSAAWLSALRRNMLAPSPAAAALLARWLFVAAFVGLAICIGWGAAHLLRISLRALSSAARSTAANQTGSDTASS